MTKPVAFFLDRLRVHLLQHGPDERARLFRFYRRNMGRPIRPPDLSRWLNLKVTPSLDVGLVFLRFAQMRGMITPGSKRDGLFIYGPPPAAEYLKKYVRAAHAKP